MTVKKLGKDEFRKAIARGVADLDSGRFTELDGEEELRLFFNDLKFRNHDSMNECGGDE